MNDRIRILAEQALVSGIVIDGVYHPEGYGCHASKTFVDKFAELLIRECIAKVSEWDIGINDPVGISDLTSGVARDMVAEIAEYFGVEE